MIAGFLVFLAWLDDAFVRLLDLSASLDEAFVLVAWLDEFLVWILYLWAASAKVFCARFALAG